MLPIGDENRTVRSIPVVTYALIVLNVLVFLLELSGGDAFIERWAFVPARFLADPVGEFITIFTSMFMHAGLVHLVGNMLYLWIFGDNVEDRFGSIKYLFFYLVCGIVAVFAQLAVNPGSTIPNVGASGAIAGILGAYILLFPQGKVRVLMGRGIVAMPALIVIGFWIILQLFSGIGAIADTAQTGGVAYWAHIGGFVAGLALTLLLRGEQPKLAGG
jgi:membrane associated rhomboid family serine protease